VARVEKLMELCDKLETLLKQGDELKDKLFRAVVENVKDRNP
jgi:hypothetical protein